MNIVVVEYDPSWPARFSEESSTLKDLLGHHVIKIHHIGSTSVPGLRAKPVIDILMEVPDIKQLDRCNMLLEEIGYEVMGEYGIPGRRYFRKGGNKRTRHIHAFQTGDPNLIRHLAFREYLIHHKQIAREYGELKSRIALMCANDIGNYSDLKDPFIQLHEKKAVDWYTRQNHSKQ